jgi:hypothetical protein
VSNSIVVPLDLEVLGWDECLALAGTQRIGRLGLTRDALPMIMPVAFAMLDATPIFRVGSGVVHRAAAQGAVSCFEVDVASLDWASAWSVMMIGCLARIDDPFTRSRAGQLQLPTWPGQDGTDGDLVRLVPQVITGRRLVRQHPSACATRTAR